MRIQPLKIIIFLLVLIGAGIGSYIYWQSRQSAFSELELSGNVDIREVKLAFRVSGRVQEVLLDEGDVITQPGQLLAVLDVQPFQNALNEAKANLGIAQANLDLMQTGNRAEDIAQALAVVQAKRAQLKNAEQMLGRQRGLAGTGAIPSSVLDDAVAGRDAALNEVEAAKQSYEALKRGFRSEQIAQAQAQVALAQARVDAAQLQFDDAQLKAPSTGVVMTRAVEAGSMVAAGTPAFTLSLNDPVWIRAYVEAPYLGQTAPGTQVHIYTDAPNGKVYEGIIGFVSPMAEFTPKQVQTQDLRTGLVYRLRVVVQNPDSGLRQGMPVTVRLAQDLK
ncbi:MAG: secretion protein HlyD [Saezia sp.]